LSSQVALAVDLEQAAAAGLVDFAQEQVCP
jgi:hypothetical protein